MGWVGDYDDPNSFLDMWITDGGNNRKDGPMLHTTVLSSLPPGLRTRIPDLHSSGRQKRSSSPSFRSSPLFYTNVYLLHPSVKGWDPNLLNIHNLKFINLK